MNKQFEIKKGIPAIISFWLMGCGQLYNRQYLKAICFWAFFIISNALFREMWMLWIVIAVWIYGIYDAYKNGKTEK